VTATLTIVDDDPAPDVSFDRSSYVVNKDAGAATITVTLSAASELTATVKYAASDGTATWGKDHGSVSGTLTLPVSGTLVFAPGVTIQTFAIPIIDDGQHEPDETVALALSDPGNAVLGAPVSASLMIRDNDPTWSVFLPVIHR
jgi:hypothetical protein